MNSQLSEFNMGVLRNPTEPIKEFIILIGWVIYDDLFDIYLNISQVILEDNEGYEW